LRLNALTPFFVVWRAGEEERAGLYWRLTLGAGAAQQADCQLWQVSEAQQLGSFSKSMPNMLAQLQTRAA